jgi:hypothetical protein
MSRRITRSATQAIRRPPIQHGDAK